MAFGDPIQREMDAAYAAIKAGRPWPPTGEPQPVDPPIERPPPDAVRRWIVAMGNQTPDPRLVGDLALALGNARDNVTRREALQDGLLSILNEWASRWTFGVEPPPPSEHPKCADCGTALGDGEARVFTVCEGCWNRAYGRGSVPPLPKPEKPQ